jgi:hypothetical protein
MSPEEKREIIEQITYEVIVSDQKHEIIVNFQ